MISIKFWSTYVISRSMQIKGTSRIFSRGWGHKNPKKESRIFYMHFQYVFTCRVKIWWRGIQAPESVVCKIVFISVAQTPSGYFQLIFILSRLFLLLPHTLFANSTFAWNLEYVGLCLVLWSKTLLFSTKYSFLK